MDTVPVAGICGESPGRSERCYKERVYALVWTTTPWTLPHEHGPGVSSSTTTTCSPGTSTEDTRTLWRRSFWIAWQRRQAYVFNRFPKHFGALALRGAEVPAPLLDRGRSWSAGEHRHAEQGSGIVRTYGSRARRRGLRGGSGIWAQNVRAALDDDGRFTEGLPEYKRHKTVFEANPAIIGLLRSRGALVAESKLQHSYPHCWRCHNPVIFRALPEQWFISAGQRKCFWFPLPWR